MNTALTYGLDRDAPRFGVNGVAVSNTSRTLASESAKSRIVNFSAGKSEVIENAFKNESVGLQTKAQFAEKRANIERELEEEEDGKV